MSTDSKVEFENDRVRVSRVKHEGHGATATGQRHDRLIVYLHDGHVTRTERGRSEVVRRKAGDVAWRPSSEHTVRHEGDATHEVLIIELKP